MGYDASGSGQVVLRKKVPDDVLALLSSAEFLVEDSPDGGLWITFDYASYNDQIEDAMNALAPYVKTGEVRFTGEDFEHWRFFFHNGKVENQDGDIVYRKSNGNRSYRVVFMQKNNDENIKEKYYFDGVTIDTDGRTTEEICVDLMNRWRTYIEENNIEDVVGGVNEIYEEE